MLINYYIKYEELVTKMIKNGRLTQEEMAKMKKLEEWLNFDSRIGERGEYDLF